MTTERMTASKIIRDVLFLNRGSWLAVHEITATARDFGHFISDNATASRLCMELKHDVEGRIRAGKRFKEWRLLERGVSC